MQGPSRCERSGSLIIGKHMLTSVIRVLHVHVVSVFGNAELIWGQTIFRIFLTACSQDIYLGQIKSNLYHVTYEHCSTTTLFFLVNVCCCQTLDQRISQDSTLLCSGLALTHSPPFRWSVGLHHFTLTMVGVALCKPVKSKLVLVGKNNTIL